MTFTPLIPGITLAAALKSAPFDALENRILICHGLSINRIACITQSERIVTASEVALLNTLLMRRVSGEPIAYIVGEREFYSLAFTVTPDVLIPRPDTELLVELAIHHLPNQGSMLDMGTGSGAIAVAVAHNRHDATVTAIDVSAPALTVAQGNAQRHLDITHMARFTLKQSDWYSAVQGEQFDVIVSNPPYIVAHDHHLAEGDLRFEPVDALTDHADGLSAYRTIIGQAPAHLRPEGWLLMEHGYDQAEAVRTLLAQHGFHAIQSWQDLAGIERVSGGQLMT